MKQGFFYYLFIGKALTIALYSCLNKNYKPFE